MEKFPVRYNLKWCPFTWWKSLRLFFRTGKWYTAEMIYEPFYYGQPGYDTAFYEISIVSYYLPKDS